MSAVWLAAVLLLYPWRAAGGGVKWRRAPRDPLLAWTLPLGLLWGATIIPVLLRFAPV